MTENKRYGREYVLNVCKNLKKEGLIKSIEEHKYSIQILINCDKDFAEDSYQVRNKIKKNFEKQRYIVEINGTYWLNIVTEDVNTRIDDCFNVGGLNE